MPTNEANVPERPESIEQVEFPKTVSPDNTRISPGFLGSLLRNGERSSEQSNSGTSSITTSPPTSRSKRLTKKCRKQRPRVSY